MPVYHPDVRAWEVTDAQGRHVGAVLRRLFRARLQAQRRLDDLVARSGEACRRYPPASFSTCELLQAGGGRADAAVLRRRAHAVPRIRPRAARAAVRRDLSVDLRHRGADRFRRTAVAALRALARAAGDPATLSPATTKPASRCRRRCSTGCWRRAPSIRASPRSNTSPRALVDLDFHSLAGRAGLDVADFERKDARAHRNAGRDRDAPPPAAFPASVLRRRLCGGLLQLHVVGSARRRRLRTPSRKPATSSIRRWRSGCATIIYAAGNLRDPAEAYKAFRGRLPTVDALLKKRGLADVPSA